MRILIVGTGPREIYLAAACQSHGHELVSSGPWDWVCLPLPRSPLPEEWKDTLPRGQKILCGQPEEALRDEAGARGWRLVNALRDDIFVRENASLTAEGALCAAMACQDGALQGQHCLVIGYGRIGQALTRMLRGVGAGVTVAARREESRILAGEGSVPIEGIPAVLPHTDFLFNTVPAPVLPDTALPLLPRGAHLFELASPPYGFDVEAARKLCLDARLESGLPGRYCPQSAAEALLRLMEREAEAS